MQPLHKLWIDGQDTVRPDLISGTTTSGTQRVRRRVRRPGDKSSEILLIRQYLQSEFGQKGRTVTIRSTKPLYTYQEPVLESIIVI